MFFSPRFTLYSAFLALLFCARLPAQDADTAPRSWYAPVSWSVFAQYSPDSSHIFLGTVQRRKFVTIGGSFTVPLHTGPLWQVSWAPEFRPVMIESDPALIGDSYSICLPPPGPSGLGQPCVLQSGYSPLFHKQPIAGAVIPQSFEFSVSYQGQTYYGSYQYRVGRRWTYVAGFSPLGFRWNLHPYARLQPFLGVTGGLAVSARDLPLFDTSAFNFTFSAGAGIQFWQNSMHATRIEYRLQHFSNAGIGASDPGIDSQMIQLSYVWTRR